MSRAIAILWAVLLALPPLPGCCRPGEEPSPSGEAVACHGSEAAMTAPSEPPPGDSCLCCEGCCDCAAPPALLGLSAPGPVAAALLQPTMWGGRVPPWIHEALERPPSRRVL